jgi:hypothetical protein
MPPLARIIPAEQFPCASKFIAVHSEYRGGELVERIRAVTSEYEVSHSGTRFAEVTKQGTHKGLALTYLCDRYGIATAETIAFGDMLNDIPLLLAAGHRVAVANAHADVLAIAHEVTASNNEDGVAMVLERLLAQGR